MRLLVLGGTSFLGRHTVAEALRRGWQVTTFNRGQTGTDADGVEAVHGDRTNDADLAQLVGRELDVVVDTCGFVPATARKAMAVLAAAPGRKPQYVYVSSISAVAGWPEQPTPADAEGLACPPDADADFGGYGELKAGCERAVSELFPDNAAHIRAGAILGPYENVNRMPWWLARMERGGDVLAPGDPDQPMQLIDARDIAAFMLDCGARRTSGTFSVTGPRGNATMRSWLEACREVTGGAAMLRWVPDNVVLAHGVEQWTELPLWVAGGTGSDHIWDVDTSRAEAAGLRCRPVDETVRDTWAWMKESGYRPGPSPHPHIARSGIDPDKEARVLAAAAEIEQGLRPEVQAQ
jgi:2'-hydroxyisoflavone reductase